MKRIFTLIIGLVMSFSFILVYDIHLDNQIISNIDIIRNHRSDERYWSHDALNLVIDENTLPIFGSSELVSLWDYEKNISSFLNGDNMNIVTIGGANYQSLNHTMALGSISDNIPSKKVALFLSPQWFVPSGTSADAFPSRFPENHLLHFLSNPKISLENKKYVLNRSLTLLSSSPLQHDRVEKYKKSLDNKLSLSYIYTKSMNAFWDLRSKYAVCRQLDEMSRTIPQIDLDSIDFSEIIELAQKQGEAQCTNNDFGIYNDYWDTYVKSKYTAGEIKEKKQVNTQSLEYDDLRCFLKVADEVGIEVILVSIPVNAKWYTYQGELFDQYYQNIFELSKEFNGVIFVDMTQYQNEKYFLKDIMHLGWKGWARINEALYNEFMNN